MCRWQVVAWLSLMIIVPSASAQGTNDLRPPGVGWRPRHYPELREIMQSSYSEPVMAPPAELPAMNQARPLPGSSMMPDIPSVPPNFSSSDSSNSLRRVSSSDTYSPSPVESFDQTPTPNDTVPWSGDPSAYESAGEPNWVEAPQQMGVDYDFAQCPEGEFWDCETNPEGRFLPFFVLGARGTGDRALGTAEFFWPFWQEEDEILFADFRGYFADDDSGEGNFGIGYRGFFSEDWLIGGYLYYDLIRSAYHHTYHQATIGAELLSLNWDFRVNGYFPHSSSSNAPVRRDTSGGTVIVRNYRERAFGGIEAEMGRRILHWGWNDCFEVRWFIGGYYFGAGNANFEDFGGPQSRLEMRIYDLGWLGEQSRLEFGLETAYDRVHNGQIGGFARVRIPLGGKKDRDRIDPLRRRLVDLPVHDNH